MATSEFFHPSFSSFLFLLTKIVLRIDCQGDCQDDKGVGVGRRSHEEVGGESGQLRAGRVGDVGLGKDKSTGQEGKDGQEKGEGGQGKGDHADGVEED